MRYLYVSTLVVLFVCFVFIFLLSWREAQTQAATRERIYLIQKHQSGSIWYVVYGVENATGPIAVEGVKSYRVYSVQYNGLWSATLVARIHCGETLRVNGRLLDHNYCTYAPLVPDKT